MAKRQRKRYKTLSYTRTRNRILRFVRKVLKAGASIEMPHILTEKQLRKQGISGQRLAKETRELKKFEQFMKSNVKIDKTEDEIAYANFVDYVIELLSPPPSTDKYFYRRSPLAVDESETQANFLVAELEALTEAEKKEVGKRLRENSTDVTNTIGTIMYDSDANRVSAEAVSLYHMITGAKNQDLEIAFKQAEYNESQDYEY